MDLKSAVVLAGLLVFSLNCGPKTIKKLPVPREKQIQAVRLVSEGDQLLKEGKDHLAMLKYLEATELNPYYEIIFNKLAVAYVKLQMFYQARQAVNRALGLNPKYAYAYNTRGIVDLAASDPRAAARSFERAVNLKPGVANFYINYGFTLIQLEKVSEARRAYQKALELDPGIFEQANLVEMNYQAETDLGPEKYYNLARVFAELGNIDFTIRYLGQAFAGGFADVDRLRAEPAFRKFGGDESFRRFLAIHGIEL